MKYTVYKSQEPVLALNFGLDRDLLCMACNNCLDKKNVFYTIISLSATVPLQIFPLKRAKRNCKHFLCGLFC